MNYQDRNAPVPYVQQWNLTLQRELPRGWTASVSYVGNHGVNLIGGNYNVNQIDPRYYAQYGLALQDQIPNPFYGQITTGALAAKTISRSQSLVSYPDYQTIMTLANHNADSIYHSVQVTVERRFNGGLSLLASFTGGKLIDDSTSSSSGESGDGTYRIGAYNRRLDRAIDPSDVSRRLVVSGVWGIPLAKNSHVIYHALAGVWQTNTILTTQTGTPLSVTGSNNFTGINSPTWLAIQTSRINRRGNGSMSTLSQIPPLLPSVMLRVRCLRRAVRALLSSIYRCSGRFPSWSGSSWKSVGRPSTRSIV
jgi:hypothetical protein